MKPAQLARTYLKELTHVHTRASNHPGHIESDLSAYMIRRQLRQARLFAWPRAMIHSIIINDHTSDSKLPYKLAPYGLQSLSLKFQAFVGVYPWIHYGLEASILPDGIIDAPLSLIEQRPIVIASRHRLPDAIGHTAESITKLMLEACTIDEIDVLGHPARDFESMKVDWARIFAMAARHDKAIEININTYPRADEAGRLSFWRDWLQCLAASEAKVTIGSDIHTKDQLRLFIRAIRAMLRNRPDDSRWYRGLTAVHESGITPDRIKRLVERPKP